MTTEEIHDKIQNADTGGNPAICNVLNILERMNGTIMDLERKVEKLEKEVALNKSAILRITDNIV